MMHLTHVPGFAWVHHTAVERRPARESGERRKAMPYLLVRHKVEDYERWKPGFEEHGATRKESGSKGVRLFRSADDPNETVILLEWDDLENARQRGGRSLVTLALFLFSKTSKPS